MELILFLATTVCLLLCGYIGITTRSPVFIIVALTAMVAGIGTPLWHLLYGIAYDPSYSTMFGGVVPTIAVLGGWVMVFPTIIVFMALRRQFGMYGHFQSWAVIGGMLMYFWVIELLGVQTGMWSYDNEIAAFGFPFSLFLALLHTFCAAAMLRILFDYWRQSLAVTLQLIPIWIGLQILTYALFGAPYYAMSYLSNNTWLMSIGLLCSLGIIGWGFVIIVNGFVNLTSTFGQTARIRIQPEPSYDQSTTTE
ncbi:MAG: hypothetical protein RLY87_2310 [Chloroflexota bacterium]|jgi:hypothetical protein